MQSIVVGDAINCLGEFKTIDAMNQLKERKGLAHLVSLEVTDEMPAKVRWQQRNLGACFLDLAFAET